MKSTDKPDRLKKLLSYSNEEILSNWSRFASLIKIYEDTDWLFAREKATELIGENEAKDYIETIRRHTNLSESSKSEVSETVNLVKPPQKKAKKPSETIYESNFKALMLLAPDLERQLLENGNQLIPGINGESVVTGSAVLTLQVIQKLEDGYLVVLNKVLNLSEYYDADTHPPLKEIEFFLNLEKRKIEAVSFFDGHTYSRVYDDNITRKLINLKESEIQNNLLCRFLRKMYKKGHRITFNTAFATGVLPTHADSPELLPVRYSIPQFVISQNSTEQETNRQVIDNSFEERLKVIMTILKEEKAYSQQEAKEKAKELIHSGKAFNYVLDKIKQIEQLQEQQTKQHNFSWLSYCMPDLPLRLSLGTLQGTLKCLNRKLNMYAVSQQKTVQEGIYYIEIEEIPTLEKSRKGRIIIAIDTANKEAWLTKRTGGFNGRKDIDTQENQTANKELNKWLDFLISVDHKFLLLYQFEDPSLFPIPDFEPGNVKLTQTHIALGVPQIGIDWVNKHKQGLVFTPRKYPEGEAPENYTKKQGFRISRTGKVFFNGRSNRVTP